MVSFVVVSVVIVNYGDGCQPAVACKWRTGASCQSVEVSRRKQSHMVCIVSSFNEQYWNGVRPACKLIVVSVQHEFLVVSTFLYRVAFIALRPNGCIIIFERCFISVSRALQTTVRDHSDELPKPTFARNVTAQVSQRNTSKINDRRGQRGSER